MDKSPIPTIVLIVVMIAVIILVTGCSNVADRIDTVQGNNSKPIYVKGTVYRF